MDPPFFWEYPRLLHNILGLTKQKYVNKNVLLELLYPVFALVIMGYSIPRQTAQARNLRLACFPLAFLGFLRIVFALTWPGPAREYAVYNGVRALFGYALAVKAVDLMVYPEDNAPQYTVGAAENDLDASPGHKAAICAPKEISTWSAIKKSITICTSLRGIGYKYSTDLKIPLPSSNSTSTARFILMICLRLLAAFLILDFVDTCWKSSIPVPFFENERSWSLMRWLFLTGFQALLDGLFIQETLQLIYLSVTLLQVIFSGHPPPVWVPLFGGTFLLSDSFHNFWNVRWHQTFRRTFMVSGSFPGEHIAKLLHLSKANGRLFGGWFGSFLFHEVPVYTLSHYHWEWRYTWSFAINACAMFAERLWTRKTGRRVGGWPGRVWFFIGMEFYD
ncbi:hypothetical protein M422DRAFT_42084 [Sphaerobolus stellatus SS14]|nr:hypothetical protein M422DRAFT_42084 [Sphaerobolus stellatus SS14]